MRNSFGPHVLPLHTRSSESPSPEKDSSSQNVQISLGELEVADERVTCKNYNAKLKSQIPQKLIKIVSTSIANEIKPNVPLIDYIKPIEMQPTLALELVDRIQSTTPKTEPFQEPINLKNSEKPINNNFSSPIMTTKLTNSNFGPFSNGPEKFNSLANSNIPTPFSAKGVQNIPSTNKKATISRNRSKTPTPSNTNSSSTLKKFNNRYNQEEDSNVSSNPPPQKIQSQSFLQQNTMNSPKANLFNNFTHTGNKQAHPVSTTHKSSPVPQPLNNPPSANQNPLNTLNTSNTTNTLNTNNSNEEKDISISKIKPKNSQSFSLKKILNPSVPSLNRARSTAKTRATKKVDLILNYSEAPINLTANTTSPNPDEKDLSSFSDKDSSGVIKVAVALQKLSNSQGRDLSDKPKSQKFHQKVKESKHHLKSSPSLGSLGLVENSNPNNKTFDQPQIQKKIKAVNLSTIPLMEDTKDNIENISCISISNTVSKEINIKSSAETHKNDSFLAPPKKLRALSSKTLKKDISMPDLTPNTPQAALNPEKVAAKDAPKSKKDKWNDHLTFKPKILNRSKRLKVNGTIGEVLYKDAKRRQNKSMEMAKRKPEVNMKFMNDKSAKLLALKLIKEFEEEANEYFGEKEHKFNYECMNEFLKILHFVKSPSISETPYALHERSLVQDIWLVLQGDKFKGVNERNLLVFLLAILGLNFEIPAYVKQGITEPDSNDSVDGGEDMRNVKFTLESIREYDGSLGRSKSFDNLISANQKEPTNQNGNNHSNNNFLHNDGETPNTIINLLDFNSPNKPPLFVNSRTNSNNVNLKVIAEVPAVRVEKEEGKKIFNTFHEDYLKHMNTYNRYGIFDEKENVTFTAEEVQLIAKGYDILYFNRLHGAQYDNSSRIPEHQYQPEILSASRILAHGYREKQLEQAAKYFEDSNTPIPSNGKLTHADLLFYQRLAQKNKIKHAVKSTKEKEMEGCTFKPRVNNYLKTNYNKLPSEGSASSNTRSIKSDERNCRKTPFTNLGKKRTNELYALAKSAVNKVNKTCIEYEFEKQAPECTFVPDLTNTRSNKSFVILDENKKKEKCKNFEKSVERTKKGRELRDFINYYSDRCFPFNSPELAEKQTPMKFSLEKLSKKAGFADKNDESNKWKVDKQANSENRYISVYNNTPFSKKKNESLTTMYKSKSPNLPLSEILNMENRVGGLDSSALYKKFKKDEKPEERLDYIERTSIIEKSFVERDIPEKHVPERDNFERVETEKSTNEKEPVIERKETKPDHSGAGKYKLTAYGTIEKVPLLYVDVNFGPGKAQRIVVYDGDTAESLANKFAKEHSLEESLRGKLKLLLENQMSGILSKIDEELVSMQSESDFYYKGAPAKRMISDK